MKPRFKILLLFLLMLLIAIILPFFANTTKATTVEELQSRILERSKLIAELDAEIKSYQGKIGETSAQANTLKNAIASIDLEIKKLQLQIKSTETKISTTNLTLESLAQKIESRKTGIKTSKNGIAASLRSTNESENLSPIETFLSEKSLSSIWTSIDEAEQFKQNLQRRIAILGEEKRALESDQNEVEDEKDKLVKFRQDLSDQQKLASATKGDKNTLLSATKNKESEYKKLLAKKEADKAAFAAELFKFESELRVAIDSSKIQTAAKGVLSWPLAKVQITQLFGKTADSRRLYTSGSHNGVDFGVPKGTKVLAALSGTVVGSGNTDLYAGCYSFGKWVMIDHHNGLSSLYAHLSVISVSNGDTVLTGDSIGLSGATGYATGPHLHFGLYATEGVRIQKFSNSANCKNAVLPLSPPNGYLDPMLYLPK